MVIMATIVTGIPGLVVYQDDIVVHRATSALHKDRLSRVLDVLAHHNLTLNEDTCIFAVPLIECGVSPDHQWPMPAPLEC